MISEDKWLPSLTVLLLLDVEPFDDVKITLDACNSFKKILADSARGIFPEKRMEAIMETIDENLQILVSLDYHKKYSISGRSAEERALIEDETKFVTNAEKIMKHCIDNNIQCIRPGQSRIYENKTDNMMYIFPKIMGEVVLLIDPYLTLTNMDGAKMLASLLEFHDEDPTMLISEREVIRGKPAIAFIRTRCLLITSIGVCVDRIIEKRSFLGMTRYKERYIIDEEYYSVGDLIRCIEYNFHQTNTPECNSIKYVKSFKP